VFAQLFLGRTSHRAPTRHRHRFCRKAPKGFYPGIPGEVDQRDVRTSAEASAGIDGTEAYASMLEQLSSREFALRTQILLVPASEPRRSRASGHPPTRSEHESKLSRRRGLRWGSSAMQQGSDLIRVDHRGEHRQPAATGLPNRPRASLGAKVGHFVTSMAKTRARSRAQAIRRGRASRPCSSLSKGPPSKSKKESCVGSTSSRWGTMCFRR
jgi:hypothetical protein